MSFNVRDLRMPGQYTDAESGLIYMRARYYDPATGVFLNRDPIADLTEAPYSYTDNNPLNLTDPTGLFGWSDITHAVHKVTSFVVRNRDTIVTVAAAGTCLIPAVGLAGCGYAAATAFGFRAEKRIEDYGVAGSLRASAIDAGLTTLTFGLGGAFESLGGTWPGVEGIGALQKSRLLGYLGRFFPAGYDAVAILRDLRERQHLWSNQC